jgi:hypothetical protein
MEPSVIHLIAKTVIEGGPYAVGIFGWIAWWYERKQNKENGDKLFGLATAQIQATVKHEEAIRANTRLMEHFLER